MARFRQRYDSLFFKSIIKYEQSTIALTYLDETNPRIGGKVKVNSKEFNFSQLTLHNYFMFGYFTNDKLVYGRFNNNNVDISNDEIALFDITKDNISETNLISRFTYKLDSKGLLYYAVEVNPNLVDQSHEYLQNSETELLPKGEFNWKEKLYHSLP